MYTPGPWIYGRNKCYFEIGPAYENPDTMPVYPSVCYGVGFDQEDNARLIAAAPSLLEALQALMKAAVRLAEDHGTDDAPIWAYIEDANEAIRKAVDIA